MKKNIITLSFWEKHDGYITYTIDGLTVKTIIKN